MEFPVGIAIVEGGLRPHILNQTQRYTFANESEKQPEQLGDKNGSSLHGHVFVFLPPKLVQTLSGIHPHRPAPREGWELPPGPAPEHAKGGSETPPLLRVNKAAGAASHRREKPLTPWARSSCPQRLRK